MRVNTEDLISTFNGGRGSDILRSSNKVPHSQDEQKEQSQVFFTPRMGPPTPNNKERYDGNQFDRRSSVPSTAATADEQMKKPNWQESVIDYERNIKASPSSKTSRLATQR